LGVDPLREVVWATAAVAALLGLGEALAALGPVAAQVGGVVVAAGFVGVPLAIARARRLAGDVWAVDPPLGPSALWGLGVAAAVLPVYALGFDAWQVHVAGRVRAVPAVLDPLAWLEAGVVQLGAVALPEELFFRGYVLGRLRVQWPGGVTVLGARVGPAHVAAAGLFAAVHLVAVPAPFRLLVFFPGLLFGWVAERSGSAVAAAVLHALCNLALQGLWACYR